MAKIRTEKTISFTNEETKAKVEAEKVIIFTDEEKEILTKAFKIMEGIQSEIKDDVLTRYENNEYIVNILALDFWY